MTDGVRGGRCSWVPTDENAKTSGGILLRVGVEPTYALYKQHEDTGTIIIPVGGEGCDVKTHSLMLSTPLAGRMRMAGIEPVSLPRGGIVLTN